jgi:hypothetical protein
MTSQPHVNGTHKAIGFRYPIKKVQGVAPPVNRDNRKSRKVSDKIFKQILTSNFLNNFLLNFIIARMNE